MGLNIWRTLRGDPTVGVDETEELVEMTEKRLGLPVELAKELRKNEERSGELGLRIEERLEDEPAPRAKEKGPGAKGRGKVPDCLWKSMTSLRMPDGERVRTLSGRTMEWVIWEREKVLP